MKKIISAILMIYIIGINLIVYAEIPKENFHDIQALAIPEKDVNLQVNNITKGSEIYLLFPTELLKYNMEKFISNNIENEFETEKEKAEDIQKYLDKEDYIGYIEYFRNQPYAVEPNAIELRQYCFALGQNEIQGLYDYEEKQYVKFKIKLDGENRYKVILKDYFVDKDCSDIKFLIDEFNTLKYINVSDYSLGQNSEKSNIVEYNISLDYVTKEDYDSIERSTKIGYFLIVFIAVIIVIILLLRELKKYKAHKAEIKEALFYKHDEKKKKEKKKKKGKRK